MRIGFRFLATVEFHARNADPDRASVSPGQECWETLDPAALRNLARSLRHPWLFRLLCSLGLRAPGLIHNQQVTEPGFHVQRP